jgi:hypothetical protein
MHTIKGVYENGQIILPEGQYPSGRRDVIVLFPDMNNATEKDPNAGVMFVQKWKGILKGCDIENWRDQKVEYLQRKHK